MSSSAEDSDEEIDEQHIIKRRAKRLSKLAERKANETEEDVMKDTMLLLDNEINKQKVSITPQEQLMKALASEDLQTAMDYVDSSEFKEAIA